MLPEVLHHPFSRRFACKQWSAIISIAILFVGMLGRFDTAAILWISAPLLLLGLTDAGYATLADQLLESLKAGKGSDESFIYQDQSALIQLRRFAGALCSISVWPFYLTLWGIVVGAAFELPKHYVTLANDAGASRTVLPGYPQGVTQRLPNTPFPSGPLRTPWPPFMRPGMTPNFGAKPPAHFLSPPPVRTHGTPQPVPGTPQTSPSRPNP
jgi:hypothetical protein